MCIAIIKPGSAPLPTLEQLQNCAKTNRDGGGLCYPTADGKIQIVKGFATAESMFDFLQTQDFANVSLMIHFRIGTHGDKSSAKHTHPFPVGTTKEEMEELSFETDLALMHNGIMSKFGYEKEISDTMAFARDALPSILEMPEVCRGIVLSEILGTYNKIALMSPDGTISKYGTWIEDGGLFWSNTSYKSYTYSADPRTWGTCGGKYKHSYSRTPYDWEEGLIPAGKETLKRPAKGQFWSEVIENDPINFDVDFLKDEFFKLIRTSGAVFPYGIEKPKRVSHQDWDTCLSYRYAYTYVSDDEWDEYLLTKRVLPGEIEVEEAVTKAIDEAAASTQEPVAPELVVEQWFVSAE